MVAGGCYLIRPVRRAHFWTSERSHATSRRIGYARVGNVAMGYAVLARDGVAFDGGMIPTGVHSRLADNRVVLLGETHRMPIS